MDDQGNVVYLTEGQLRLIHRKIPSDEPPFKINVPYHSFKNEDAQPIIPKEVTKIQFGLLPISALVKRGHRIRVAIAGHDKDTFRRYPSEGIPVLKILRNSVHASYIDLPIIR